MTRPFSVAFKQKMVQRLTGKDAVTAMQLSRETGVRQQNLSRWLQEARSLPLVSPNPAKQRRWSVEQKARVVAEAANLTGEQLQGYLDQAGVQLVEFERWAVPHSQTYPSLSATPLREPCRRAALDDALRRLVQRGASAQRDPVCDSG
jgi:transposase-like protein